MASHTDLVARIGEAGAIPANRPLDHARRIITAATIGTFFGTLAGILFNMGQLTLGATMLVGAVFLIGAALFLLFCTQVWFR